MAPPRPFARALVPFLPVLLLVPSPARADAPPVPVLRLDVSDPGRPFPRRDLLGTNVALWHEPRLVGHADVAAGLDAWRPGVVRLPGGSWSNEYVWNGNGVRTGPETLDAGAFKDGRWQVDYSGYAPGFRVKAGTLGLADYHGVIDVLAQHRLAERHGAAQMVTVNVGTGDPEMGAEWLRWSRGQGFDARWWEIGNELNGQWEAGHFLPDGTAMTGPRYAAIFREHAEALRAVDPGVRLVGPACSDLDLAFVEDLLRDAGDLVDVVSVHAYPVGVGVTETRAKFEAIDKLPAALGRVRDWIRLHRPERYGQIGLAVTEWNMKVNEDRDTADVIGGLWSAAWIGTMAREGVEVATHWDLFTRRTEGGHSAFTEVDGRVVPTASYWAHHAWANLMGDAWVETSGSHDPDLRVFATRSEGAFHVMVVNTSETRRVPLVLEPSDPAALAGTGSVASWSSEQYAWDPHHHRPLWSLPPEQETLGLGPRIPLVLPPFALAVIELPLAGRAPSPQDEQPAPWFDPVGQPRVVVPDSWPADLPLEVVLAYHRFFPFADNTSRAGRLEVVDSDGTRSFDLDPRSRLERVILPPGPPGEVTFRLSQREGRVVTATTRRVAVALRPQVAWTFDGSPEAWGVKGTFPIRMEPSVKPNEFVAESVLDGAVPGEQRDTLFHFEPLPEGLARERIGGLVLELRATHDLACEDPDAQVRLVLQSEADHWIPLVSRRLADLRGTWDKVRVTIDDPRLLAAMARLYAVRIQLDARAPVKGSVYLDNLGFLMRSPGEPEQAAAKPPRRPNVLLVVVDDLKPVAASYGGPAITPAMDALAARGVRFDRAYCQQAVCAPSRASTLTGLLPDTLGVWDLKTPVRLRGDTVRTLPERLVEAGYRTAAVGKVYDPRSVDAGHDRKSWTEGYAGGGELPFSDAAPRPVGFYQGDPVRQAAARLGLGQGTPWAELQRRLVEAEAWPAWERADVPDDAYEDGAIANRAIDLLGSLAAGSEPFLLAVGFKKPHLPFTAPGRYWDLYDPEALPMATFAGRAEGSPAFAYHQSEELRAYTGVPRRGPLDAGQSRAMVHGYLAATSYVDAQVGRVLDELDRLGLRDSTWVVLWGDHGFHLGDHGLWCKHTAFEQATRSPLVVSGPGVVPGAGVGAPVELLDIAPTLLELVGLPSVPELEGRSLAPLLRGAADTGAERPAFSLWPKGDRWGYALRDRRYRYVAWLPGAEGVPPPADRVEPVAEELYDLEVDPHETRSLAADPAHAAVVAGFRAALLQRRR